MQCGKEVLVSRLMLQYTRKESCSEATKIFQNTGINITVKGRTYLGSFIGTSEEKELQISKKIEILKEELI